MDLQTLCNALSASLSADANARAMAEQALQQWRYAPGQPVALLQAIAHSDTDSAIRQSASIQLKQLVDQAWAPGQEGSIALAEDDKQVVRNNLVEAMVQAEPHVRAQLGEAFKTAAEADYPVRWPQLVEELKSDIFSREYTRMTAGLHCLRLLSRKYEFKDGNERQPLEHIANECMPMLLDLIEHMLSQGVEDAQAAELMKLALKTFWSSTYLDLPQHLAREDVFHSWLSALHKLLLQPVPTQYQPADIDERKRWPWWKLKKWVLHVVNRMFTRYGDTRAISDTPAHKQERLLAQRFEKEYAPQFVEGYVALLNSFAHGHWLPDRVINLSLQNLRHCLSKPSLYKHIRPNLDLILYSVVFPLLCFNNDDDELWHEDPHEYIRRNYDVVEDMYSVRTAAVNFLTEVARTRKKNNLNKWLNHINNILHQHKQGVLQQHYPQHNPDRLLDGALCSVGALSTTLKNSNKYSGSLEPMLMQYVLPYFNSSTGHVRAKACWVAGYYANADFNDHGVFRQLFQAVVRALSDSELPVRVDALVALRPFVEELDDVNQLKGIVEEVLTELFKLLHEVDNEDVVYTLEAIVEKFGEEISPYALQLLDQLVSAFWKLIQSEEQEESEGEMGALASVGCLRAMSTIMDSVSSVKTLFPEMEKRIFPLFQHMLNEQGQDIYEELLELLAYLTYYSPRISDQLWSLWEPLIQQGCTWANRYLETIIIPLDNYVTRGTETFLQSEHPNCVSQAFQLAQRTLQNDELDADEMLPGAKILNAIMQSCQGRIDHWIEAYITLALDTLHHAQSKKLKTALVLVVANAVLYNPVLTMQILHRTGRLQEAFGTWSTFLMETNESGKRKYFKRETDKKVNGLALLALLRMPREATPQEVEGSVGSVFGMAVSMLQDYKQQSEEREAEEQNQDYFVDEDDFADELNDLEDVDEDEEQEEEGQADGSRTDDGASKAQKDLASALGLRSSAAKELFDAADDDADSEDDILEDLDDEEDVETPVDKVNAFMLLKQTVDQLAHSDTDRLNRMRSGVSAEQASAADALYQHAAQQEQQEEQQQSTSS